MIEKDAWRDRLEHAYGLLLGRPLSGFDPGATYALYHWDDAFCDEFFAGAEEVDLDGFARPETRDSSTLADTGEPGLSPDRWRFDLGRTIFLVDDFDHPVATALPAARLDSAGDIGVLGVDLRRVFLDEEVDLDELTDQYAHMLLRVQTDGTLFDALRAATWTMSAPDGLEPRRPEAEIDAPWQPLLAQIDDGRLRGHFEMLCLTAHWARSDGAHYLGPKCRGDLAFLTTLPGYRIVAGWEFGEAQAASAVVQLG